MTDKFETEIQASEQALVELRAEMTEVFGRWLDAAVPWFQEQWQKIVDSAIASQPDVVANMTEGERSEAKRATATFIASASDRVPGALGPDVPNVWPHSASRDDWWQVGAGHPLSNFTISEKKPDPVLKDFPPQGPMDGLRDECVEVLENAGFGSITIFRGRNGPEWSPEMINIMNEYAALHDQATSEGGKIKQLREDQTKANAADLWNSA